MAATTAKRAQPIEWGTRLELAQLVLAAVGLEDVEPSDVLSLHLGTRSVGIRRKVRGRSGKVVHGHTLTTSHDILPEPVED